MPDTATAPEPAEPPLAGPERAMLAGWLEYHRATLLEKCGGLADAQRKRRPVSTSLMSLHGLVRHLSDVERNWFQRCMQRNPALPGSYWTDAGEDAAWGPLDGADWAADVAGWQAECAQSRRTAAAHDLDGTGAGVRGGRQVECSLRWVYQHMIEEYARHNGHADLIRELVAPPGG
ncbi:MAG: DinB family protein [Streptosporangiaceae bacterium]